MPQLKRSFEQTVQQDPSSDLLAQETARRLAAEQALREMTERFDLCVTGSANGFWEWNIQTGEVWYSKQLLEMLGYDESDEPWPAKIDPFDERIHPDDRDRVWEAVDQHLKHDQPYAAEMRLRTKGGQYRWYDSRGVAARDPQGRPLRMAGSVQDIEQSRAAQESQQQLNSELEQRVARRTLELQRSVEQLKESERKFRQLAENVKEVFWIANTTDFELEYVSPAFADIWGWPCASGCGCRSIWTRAIAEEDREVADQAFAIGQTGSKFDVEYRIWRPDGTIRWIRDRGFPVLDDDQPNTRVAGIAIDVTEQKKSQQQLADYLKELERQNDELDHFAYIASHDLRAPLRGIRTICGWIREDCKDLLPEASLQHIEELDKRAVRMKRLLASILLYARAGRTPQDIVRVDTHQLLQNVLETIDLPEGFVVDVPQDLPVLQASPEPLEQVFQNLISNAIKHHDRQSGRVTVAWQRAGKWIEFRVIDDGPGIPHQFHAKVFEMFQTLRPRDEVEGSGIGLSVVRKLIESQGGTIRIESGGTKMESTETNHATAEPQRGTSFVFTWPDDLTAGEQARS